MEISQGLTPCLDCLYGRLWNSLGPAEQTWLNVHLGASKELVGPAPLMYLQLGIPLRDLTGLAVTARASAETRAAVIAAVEMTSPLMISVHASLSAPPLTPLVHCQLLIGIHSSPGNPADQFAMEEFPALAARFKFGLRAS